MSTHVPAELPRPHVVYVCSSARCGSTVTDMFLGGHPRIASLGESNFLGKAVQLGQACTCGATVRECLRWNAVFDAILADSGVDLRQDPYGWPLWNARARVIVDHERQGLVFNAAFRLRKSWLLARARLPQPLRSALPLPPLLSTAVKNKLRLYQVVASAWGRSVVVDSSKNPFEAIELARRWPDRILVVLLTRDGRGVFLSKRSSGFARGESVSPWQTYYRRVLPLLQRDLPAANLARWRYEDIASDPEAFARSLCQKVGLDYDPAMMDLASGDRHMVGGNETRFAPGRGIRLDERWRRELQGDELDYFMRHGGRLNERLGYT